MKLCRLLSSVGLALVLAASCGGAAGQGFGSESSGKRLPDAPVTPAAAVETTPTPAAPGAATAEPNPFMTAPGAATTEPNPFMTTPGAATAEPNPFMTTPGAATTEPNPFMTTPGAATAEPNPFMTAPGAATTEPNPFMTAPGAATTEPNPFMTAPGAATAEPNPFMTTPGAATTEPNPFMTAPGAVGVQAATTGSAATVPFGVAYTDAIAASPSTLVPADRVLVKKSERRLYLLRSDRVIANYPIRLGLSPKGPKQREGDFRTPEGVYEIASRNSHSDFFLSLEVSYPNDADRERARELGTQPGGMIMIHGQPNAPHRPRNYYVSNDWTDGCIAVSNSDMVEIWMRTPVGVPIEIRP